MASIRKRGRKSRTVGMRASAFVNARNRSSMVSGRVGEPVCAWRQHEIDSAGCRGIGNWFRGGE